MKIKIILTIILVCMLSSVFAQDANTILKKIDNNMISNTQVVESEMVIHGRRSSRTIVSKGYTEGTEKSFTEYLAPAREKGTKMLKLKDRLWIYSPSTDRTIQLSGHMLRQSVMGSDLSYEDMMEDRRMTDMYNAKISGKEVVDGRETLILVLTAKVDDAAYYGRKIWVDIERFIPLKEELFAKSGQLLKRTTMSNISKTDGRWYPRRINYKDMLKKGKGTDFIIKTIEFNPEIPDYIFSKASLRR